MNDVTETGKQKLARLEASEQDIIEKVAAGVLTTDLIRELGVGWKLWSKWLRARPGREQEIEDARKQAAHFFAARAVKESQEAEPGTVNVSRLRVETDKWLASRFNRDVYDQRQSGVSVNLSVGDLWAQAQQLINSGDAGEVIDGIWSDEPLHNDQDHDGDDDTDALEPADLVNTFSGAMIRE